MSKRDFARSLRQQPTDAESLMWYRLRDRRFAAHKFRRQVPIGHYVVDFVCQEARLIVELDGGQHAAARAYDAARDDWLRGRGYEVLRFPDNVVLKELDLVLDVVWRALHPSEQ